MNPGTRSADSGPDARKTGSEELHRIAIENIPDPIFITDSDGRFTFISPNIEQVLGYSTEEIRAMGRISALLGDTLFDMDDLDRRGQVSNIEAVIVTKTGCRRDYLVTVKQVSIKGGAVLYVCHDISERKQSEAERNARLYYFRQIERVDQAIRQETDVERMLWDIVQTVYNIFDCDRVWLLYPCDPDAPSFRVPIEINRPEYPGAKALNLEVPMAPGQAQDMRDALASEDPVVYTYGTDMPVSPETARQFHVQAQMFLAIYPKVGRAWLFGMHQCSHPRVWTPDEQKLFKEIGRRIADGLSSVLFLRDVQMSEERFRSTFEQAAVGMAHLSTSGRWLRVNQRFCDMVGYSREELIEKTFQDITHPDDLETDQANTRRLLAGEISTYNREKRYLHKDGSVVWINLTVSLVRQPSDDPDYFLKVIEDISERRQAEKEKEELQSQLLQVQKLESIGRLAGGVAHDFNNMISVIIGNAELALGKPASATTLRPHLEQILSAAKRSADITRQGEFRDGRIQGRTSGRIQRRTSVITVIF
jgi:PAS domain S-box-containing protein